MYNNVIHNSKSWYKVEKNCELKEWACRTKRVAILTLRHWDSPKIKKQTYKHLLAQKNGSPLKDPMFPQKNHWAHVTHHSSSDGERFSTAECIPHTGNYVYKIFGIVGSQIEIEIFFPWLKYWQIWKDVGYSHII